MGKEHRYETTTVWTGNLGSGTSSYRSYSRNHEIAGAGKSNAIACSSDAHFRGDASRYNPEELLVASLSACHMLSFLHLCADAGITVTAYTDSAVGTMRENGDGSGEFIDVVLRPEVRISEPARTSELAALHDEAHCKCFIARSVNFEVRHEPVATAGDQAR